MALDKVVDSAVLDADLLAVADAIREKGGTSEKLAFPEGFISAVEEISAGGGENALDYATSITNMFSGAVLSEDVDLQICFGSKATSEMSEGAFNKTFYNFKNAKTIEISYDGTGNKSSLNAFAAASSNPADTKLERIVFSGSLTTLRTVDNYRAFYRRAALREIVCEFDMTQSAKDSYTLGMFQGCTALETVRFTAGTIAAPISFTDSPNLTDASIQSIVDGLADLTDGTAQTLTLHADVGAKLTDEQKTAASAKNWTISY